MNVLEIKKLIVPESWNPGDLEELTFLISLKKQLLSYNLCSKDSYLNERNKVQWANPINAECCKRKASVYKKNNLTRKKVVDKNEGLKKYMDPLHNIKLALCNLK